MVLFLDKKHVEPSCRLACDRPHTVVSVPSGGEKEQ
jgi:hypothetical protein